jgi:hypothetical protein
MGKRMPCVSFLQDNFALDNFAPRKTRDGHGAGAVAVVLCG